MTAKQITSAAFKRIPEWFFPFISLVFLTGTVLLGIFIPKYIEHQEVFNNKIDAKLDTLLSHEYRQDMGIHDNSKDIKMNAQNIQNLADILKNIKDGKRVH